MANTRIKDLVPKGLPPAAQVTQFITFFVNHGDLPLAAAQARLMPELGEKLYKHPQVRERIDRKLLLVDVEQAKLVAKSKALTVDLLDASLAEEVKSKKNGHIRVRAIELGYKRTGMIRDGEFVGVPMQGGGGGPKVAKTYGQITTVRRTTTEEVVHESSETVAVAIEAKPFARLIEQPEAQDY